ASPTTQPGFQGIPDRAIVGEDKPVSSCSDHRSAPLTVGSPIRWFLALIVWP
ncbi:uncharacterized protein L969DRAFT_47909, partial [Mixia osmundae IAM 14324]